MVFLAQPLILPSAFSSRTLDSGRNRRIHRYDAIRISNDNCILTAPPSSFQRKRKREAKSRFIGPLAKTLKFPTVSNRRIWSAIVQVPARHTVAYAQAYRRFGIAGGIARHATVAKNGLVNAAARKDSPPVHIGPTNVPQSRKLHCLRPSSTEC